MRIDYVITGLEIGGAEYQVVALLEQLALRGHQMRLISLIPPSSAIFTDRLAAANIPVHSLAMRSSKDLPQALFRLRKVLRQSRPDIVHGHMIHANLLSRLVRLLLPSLTVISTAHSTREGGKLRDWAYRLTSPLSQMNTCISEAATHRFISERVFPRGKTRTIFNGIDTEKFHPAEPKQSHGGPFRWLAAGRLAEEKDYPVLITAFSQLPASTLLIAGNGPLLASLKQQVIQAGLEDRVEFLGVRYDIAQLYRQVDGFVLSSEREGYGLVVAEAMASELPVVVTHCGGPAEIVGEDGAAGWVVPVKNPSALANALASVEALSGAERALLGKTGRKKIQDNFSLHQIVTQWEHLYAMLSHQAD